MHSALLSNLGETFLIVNHYSAIREWTNLLRSSLSPPPSHRNRKLSQKVRESCES